MQLKFALPLRVTHTHEWNNVKLKEEKIVYVKNNENIISV